MIPLGDPPVGDDEIAAVAERIDAGALSTGETVAAFEERFATLTDAADAAAVCSGSVALEMALEVSPLESGDRVAVSPYNCGAVLYSLLRSELDPVFVDIDPATYNVSPDEVAAVAPDVDGLAMVHLFGQPCDVDPLIDIAGDHDLTVVEAFAQAPGATYRGDPVGSLGDVGACSFGATKNLTTAEGGAVVGDSDDADRVRTRRTNDGGDIDGVRRSVRMNDLEAAIGIEQLASYDEVLRRKRRAADAYRGRLPDQILPVVRDDRSHVYHGFPIRIEDREGLRRHLDDAGVETASVYEPLHTYDSVSSPSRPTPEAERAADEVLLVPIHGSITVDEVETVAEAINEWL
jgi:dTDP-4-amino-4,6-dideoxygalactose transaminase